MFISDLVIKHTHVEKQQAEVVRSSAEDTFRVPPVRVVMAAGLRAHREHTDSYVSSGPGTPWDPEEELEGVAGERLVWGSAILSLL